MDNRAGQAGAGVTGSGIVRNSFVAHNSTRSSESYGGGINGPAVENCVVLGNSALYGAGAYTRSIVNSTFVNNCGGGCGTFTFDHGSARNSIFVRTAPCPSYIGCNYELDPEHFDSAYSLVESRDFVGAGNVVGLPLFVSLETADVRLRAGSPGIDAGDGASAPATDKDGNPRVDDPLTPDTGSGSPPFSDMGAYEYQPPAPR